jgi:hypothetical protein
MYISVMSVATDGASMWSAATKVKPEIAISDRPKIILSFSLCYYLKVIQAFTRLSSMVLKLKKVNKFHNVIIFKHLNYKKHNY